MNLKLETLIWFIPLLPFAGFLINGTLGRKLPRAVVSAVALLFTALPAAIVTRLWIVMRTAGAPLRTGVSTVVAVTGVSRNAS